MTNSINIHSFVNEHNENKLLETLRFGESTYEELKELLFKSDIRHYNEARQTIFSYLHNYENNLTKKIIENSKWLNYILDNLDYKHQTGSGYNAAMIVLKDIKEKKFLNNAQIEEIIDKTILKQLTSYNLNVLGIALIKCSENSLNEKIWTKITKIELVNTTILSTLNNLAQINKLPPRSQDWVIEGLDILIKYIDKPKELYYLIENEQKEDLTDLKSNKHYKIWKERLLLSDIVEDIDKIKTVRKI